MVITRTYDEALIKAICAHPKVWPFISADDVSVDEWQPPMGDLVYWLTPILDKIPIGVFMFYPVTSICWDSHVCVLPDYWGPVAKKAANLALQFIFSETSCEKVIAQIPVCNRLAISFARQTGLAPEWINKKSVLKNGMQMDQIVLATYKGS